MKNLEYNIEKYLSLLVVLLSIVTLFICFFFPVYTDEILWKVTQGRYWPDGNQELSLTLFPSCGAYAYHVPMAVLPFRMLTALLYNSFSNPLSIRLFGISLGLIWLFMTWLLFCNVMANKIKKTTIALCLIAFITLGVMPFLLILSRPEQLLLLCMTVFFAPLLKEQCVPSSCQLGLAASSISKPLWMPAFADMASCLGIILLAALMLTIHPKAIFALPLVFTFTYRYVYSRSLAVFCMIAVSVFAAITYHDWSLRWSCPNDPTLAAILRNLNLGSVSNINEAQIYFKHLLALLLNPESWYIAFATPKDFYVASMIPPFTGAAPLLFGQVLQIFLASTALISLFIYLYGAYTNWSNIKLRISYFAIGSIWLFYAISVITRIEKNDYEATLIFPLLALAVAGTIWITYKSYFARLLRLFFLSLLTLSVISQLFLITHYMPYVFTSWSHPGYLQEQRFSLSNFGYGTLKPAILKTAEKCGIRPGDHLQHLVVDELTYFVFRDSHQPFFMSLLEEKGWGAHRPDPTKLFASYKSAGMIVGCQWVPTVLRGKMIRDGEFCCVSGF